jgi:hypothetical protein
LRDATIAKSDDREILADLHRRVFEFDLMADAPWPTTSIPITVEVVTMLAFTTSFNDAEMAQVARCVSALRPRRIVDVSLFENIAEGYGGRLGVERFFAPHGYRQRHLEWVPDPLSRTQLRRTFGRAYWPARTLSVLELDDTAPAQSR